MVKQVKDPDTIDFRSIASIPFGTRQKLLQSPSLLDVLSRELTPGQRAALFPTYYKEAFGSSAGQRGIAGSMSGGGSMSGASSSMASPSDMKEISTHSSVEQYSSEIPHGRSTVGGTSAVGAEMSSGQQKLLSLIASGEGGYNSSNRGTIKNKIIGSTHNTTRNGKTIPDLTVGEIMKYQSITDPNNPDRLFAVGKYQLIPETFKGAVNFLGLKSDDKLTPEIQEKMGLYLISEKRPIVGKYLRGETDDLLGAQKALALEFASIPVPVDMMVQKRFRPAGASAYGSGNKAAHSIEEVKQTLVSAREEHLSQLKEQQTATAAKPGDVQSDDPTATPATVAAEQYADSASVVPPAGMQTSEFYNTMRAMTQEKIGPDDPIWDQVDPSLKKNKHMIVDAETKLVGRDALLSADAAAKVLRKNGYIPRPVSGGDNHSANHGRGRDANYSIDMAASVKDESGKLTDVRLGSGVPYEVRRDMAIAAKLASEGSSTNFRVGFPNNDSNASMHLQQDPQRKEGLWGYDRRTAAGADASRFILETTGEGKRFISDMAAVSEMNKNDKDALLSNITGNAVPSSQSANTTEGEVEKIEKQEVPKPIEEKAQENQQAQASNAPGTVAVDSAAPITAPASTVTPVQQGQTTEGNFMSNMLAFADGGVINKPYIAQPVDGQGPNVLMGEAGSETVVPQKKIAAMEVGQQQYQKINQIAEARMTEIQQTPNVEVDNQKEAQRVSIQSGMSSPKPTVGVNVNHTVLPPSARKAYADSKLEPRLNGLTNIGSVYVNHGYT